jgi:hypothetical protein
LKIGEDEDEEEKRKKQKSNLIIFIPFFVFVFICLNERTIKKKLYISYFDLIWYLFIKIFILFFF